jgi:hypothetical protein
MRIFYLPTYLYTRLLAKTIRVSAPIGSNIDTPYDNRNCTKNEETNSVFVKDGRALTRTDGVRPVLVHVRGK